jgi:hypothetical protein
MVGVTEFSSRRWSRVGAGVVSAFRLIWPMSGVDGTSAILRLR